MCTVIAFFLYPYMKKQDHKIWEEAIGFLFILQSNSRMFDGLFVKKGC